MNKKFIWLLAIFMVLYFAAGYVAEFYIDYEWFRINSALNLFWILFFTKFNVQFLFAILFIVLFSLNFLLIKLLGGKSRILTNSILERIKLPFFGSPKKALIAVVIVAVIAMGFLMGSAASSFWKEYLMFKNSVPFDAERFPVDPVFKLNIGFYVFSLPFYQFLYGWLMSSLVMITVFSVFFHVVNGGIQLRKDTFDLSLFSRAHISTLLAVIVMLHGISYRLSAYELLFSKIGKFYGAGYTAINANLMAYNAAMVISFIAAALLLFNIFKKSFKLPLFVLALLIPAYFILGTVFPGLLQRFVVVPNELDKEKQYIENNIKYTRIGYNIDRVEEVKFANNSKLTYKDIKKNKNTLNNVRLWDYRPLKQTYKQLQELKPYYYFNDVDVDRYIINNEKTAINLSARELSIDKLGKNSQTWINRHLIYTHGYGFVASRVDKITSEGLPEMLVYDIPPKSIAEIEIKQPQIYYGEHKNDYVITNTSIQPGEFDYPSGDTNKYTTYSGSGGTKFNSFFKKMLFAIAFRDINILISKNISSESKILYRRNIVTMVKTLTPFLDFDTDPYLFISGGKMYWMIDAFTTTDRFPYSTPINLVNRRKINYIRNSVKVIINAYSGKIDYYVSDTTDPIIKAYEKMFPGFFKEFAKMPADSKKHVRYPENMFNIQAHMLLRYHMTKANVFYNNEDAWQISKQLYEKTVETVRSYYLVTKLPNEKDSEFILIIPFTPYNKNNMIAFLTVKCDPENYGQLKLYTLPKDKLSYGPLQIEARIDQNPDISKQLTLWSQKGSSVIRGNMLVIPIEESLIFIEPLYLKAESSEMPELKRVIIAFADKIVMEKNLNDALDKIFLTDGIYIEEGDKKGTESEQIKDLAARAFNFYNNAEKNLKAGNWAKYGEEINKLKNTLTRMKNLKK